MPGRHNSMRLMQYDEGRYKDHWGGGEAMLCRHKDFHKIAFRYDKLARNFLSGLNLAAAVALLAVNKFGL